jgi:putative IMPACT (imprinted ancient) family translation regulator
VQFDFPYEKINDVMRVVKKMQGKVVQQNFHEQNCQVEIAVRKKDADALHEQLKHILIGTGK